jgi:hypothetical protein
MNDRLPVMEAEFRRIANEIVLTLVFVSSFLARGDLSWMEK